MAGAKITNRLPQFIAERQHRAARAMTQALIIGASEASVFTPIDTSNLLNSQTREVRVEGGQIVGTVAYIAPYALPTHDPDHPQNFRRASAQKEYLTKGMEKAEPNIRAVLTGAIKA